MRGREGEREGGRWRNGKKGYIGAESVPGEPKGGGRGRGEGRGKGKRGGGTFGQRVQ